MDDSWRNELVCSLNESPFIHCLNTTALLFCQGLCLTDFPLACWDSAPWLFLEGSLGLTSWHAEMSALYWWQDTAASCFRMAWTVHESKQTIHPNESVLFLWWFREIVISRWKSWFSIAADSTRHARAHPRFIILSFFLSNLVFWVIGFHLCINLHLRTLSTLTVGLEAVFMISGFIPLFFFLNILGSVRSGDWIVSVVCISHDFHLILLWVDKPNAFFSLTFFGPEHVLFAPHQSCLTPPHSFPFKCVSPLASGKCSPQLQRNKFISSQKSKGFKIRTN